MLLSIGMIVKNEEKYLDRCLSAINPILDALDSELIIADTGSSDRTVEIAKRYTDNVYSFEWINDFAAARNSTLERASGEWYMFLDADEIFTSCDEIIGFFSSGEYRQFNSATYIIRSLYSSGESSDFDAHRLTKKTENTAFTGIVHEQLNTFGEPIKRLNDVAEHFGYLNDDDSNQKKFERNSELLLKKLRSQDDPDPIIYLQLYECFYLHDREKALNYLEQGIAVCEKKENPTLIALYCHKAHVLFFDERFDEVLKVCDKYFEMSSRIRSGRLSTDAEMLAFKASSYSSLKKYDDAVKAYARFFDVYKDMENGSLHTKDADLLVYYLASEANLSVTVYEFLNACLALSETHCAADVLDGLRLDDKSFPSGHSKAIAGIMLRLMDSCTDIENAEILFKKFAELGMQFVGAGEPEKNGLPEDIKAAACAADIIAFRVNKQYKDCFAAMKNTVSLYPRTAHIIGIYQKVVLEEYEESSGSGGMTELQKLAVSIKNNIRHYIALGNNDAARKTLEQYRQIMPSDPEIVTLLSVLDSK